MKIHVGIVTYNNSKDLNALLKSLIESDLMEHEYHIEVVNNHPTFYVEEEFKSYITVHHTERANHTEGYIAKDYNSIIIRGFESLTNPKNDLVITIQDDNTVKPDFVKNLIEFHKKYTMVTSGPGDNFVSYMPDAIKNIGLWDEYLPSIGDADFLLRSVIWNYENTSLNDIGQGRVINCITHDEHKSYLDAEYRTHSILTNCVSITENAIRQQNLSHLWNRVSTFSIAFSNKWGKGIPETHWNDEFISSIRNKLRPKINQKILYPDFEKDIIDVKDRY